MLSYSYCGHFNSFFEGQIINDFLMARIHWTVWRCCRHILDIIYCELFIVKLTLCSFFYNEFADLYYVGDACMEPMFWFVDHFTKFLGPICVIGAIFLVTSIVVIAYVIGLPFYWNQCFFPLTVFLLIVGHWLLINVVFHYYMAYVTAPGYPPEGALIPEAVSICKKCIAPKPPRTHHCSVCNRCVLKMDHHCPWLNNCIGHYNHRYFFTFCVFTWMGSIFVMIFGLPVAWIHYTGETEPLNSTFLLQRSNQDITESSDGFEPTINNKPKRTWTEAMYHSSIVYAALLCAAAFVAVGALIAWHARLISKGETSIEGHINKKERIRMSKEGKVYKNPYDLGIRKNWKLFLGIHSGRSWWHIVFPSTHKPNGNGLQWHTQSCIQWPDDKLWKKELAKS